MISTLPLLPSDWGQWDWNASNGMASVGQTKEAYQALINSGYCSAFSRYVWNDIVNMVSNALSEAGISWDSTYCDAASCRINEKMGILTATAFNSVALNINRLNFFQWKWSRDIKGKGYIGRDNFYGYSEYGEDADYIYGWHIIELTSKLNKFLDVLKSTGDFSGVDFSELEELISSQSNVNSNLFNCNSGSINYSNQSTFNIIPTLARIGVLMNESLNTSYTYQNGILLPREPSILLNDSISTFKINADAIRSRSGAMHFSQMSDTVPRADLTSLVFAGYMQYKIKAQSSILASMEVNNIKKAQAVLSSIDYVVSEAIKRSPSVMDYILFCESHTLTDLVSDGTNPFFINGIIESKIDTDLLKAATASLIYNFVSETKIHSELTTPIIGYFDYIKNIEVYVNSKLNRARTGSLLYNTQINSFVNCVGELCRSENVEAIYKSNSYIDTAVNRVRVKDILSFANIKSMYDSELIFRDVIKILTQDSLISFSDGILDLGIPKYFESKYNKSHSFFNSELDYAPLKPFKTHEQSKSYEESDIDSVASTNANTILDSNTNSTATLESAWYPPVWIGDGWWFRQFYDYKQTGNELEVF